MKGQPNRLGADTEHQLIGTAIDRGKPIQFRLDGRLISGFAGDTILSAVLATGIDTVGLRRGSPLALSGRFAPVVIPAALARDHQRALPMERTPASDGADLVTLAGRSRAGAIALLAGRLGLGGRTLGLDLDRHDSMHLPWLTADAEPGQTYDLIVVGGGVAGMSAALAAADAGLRVVLVEASPELGGHARLFGTIDGEETPEQSISRLSAAIGRADAITTLTHAQVIAARPGAVRVHVVAPGDAASTARVVDLHGGHIVLATGTIERLPVFPGNRLPGVIGACEALELAHNYSIWGGASALVATVSSPAYRLAMLAADAGISVTRILDGRIHPQSRFIEFAKAYGITQAAGTVVASARRAGKGLAVSPLLAVGDYTRPGEDIAVDRLIACGGWQPDLSLWHMASGESIWNAGLARLEPRSGPPGIALAGIAAGYMTRSACLASGVDAIDLLLQRKRRAVEERFIDPIYETPDAPTPISSSADQGSAPIYLDGARRHIELPRPRESRWPTWLPFAAAAPNWSLADTPQPLDVGDVAAGVQIGAIPAASAGIVAQERVAMITIGNLAHDGAEPASHWPNADYLAGRYGQDAERWLLAPLEARRLEVGALIYRSADETDPLLAVGVVIRTLHGSAVALIAKSAARPHQQAVIREQGRDLAIRLVAPYVEGMKLDAALGTSAGAP